MVMLLVFLLVGGVEWQHPAGLITDETIAEARRKIETRDWAHQVYEARKSSVDKWLSVPFEELRRVFPTKRGNVYHNFSCPNDRTRLRFDPFNPRDFACPACDKTFVPQTDAGIYAPGDRYHGDMYDGWACRFYQAACSAAVDMAVIGRIEHDGRYFQRAIEILLLYANTLEQVETDFAEDRQFSRVLKYHREGDNKILNDLALAYELLRGHMTPDQRARVERSVLKRMLEDIMLEPIYTYKHNNVYQWHRTILQTALAL